MDPQGDNNLSIDNIYDDFEDFDLGKTVDKYKKENEELKEHIQTQEINIKKLADALEEMQKVNENLTRNISALYKTAKSELERKEGTIADLRTQRDNTAFRRRGGQFQTHINNNSNIEKVDNLKTEVINSNVKNEVITINDEEEVIDTNVKKEAIHDVYVLTLYSEGEISDKNDLDTDIEIGEKAFSDKYNKETRENWHKEGTFRDRHNNNDPKSRYTSQRNYSNSREQDYQKYGVQFDTNTENNTRRHKESDSRRYKELESRRYKEIDSRRHKDREDTHRDDFQESDARRYKEFDTRRPKDREDTNRDIFQEINKRRHTEMDSKRSKDRDDKYSDDFEENDIRRQKEDARRPRDRENTHRDNFHTRDVRNERDRSTHRKNEDIRFDKRKNEESKRGLIRHNPRRDSSSYLSPTRRRHKSESDKNSKKTEDSKKDTKKMLKIVNKLEKQNRSLTPPLVLLQTGENKDEIAPKRTEPIKNFFTCHLDNILESIQSNLHEKMSNSNQQEPNTTLHLETIFSDENFSQEEEIRKKNKQKKKKHRRRIESELINDLFGDSQDLLINNEVIEEEEQERKSKKKKKHKKDDTEVETIKIKSKKKSKVGVLEEVELTSISNKISFEFTADDEDNEESKMKKKQKSKEKDTATDELIFSKNEKLSTKKTQYPKENQYNTPVSDSVEKVRDYDVEFAPPLKRYIKKCQELSEEGAKFKIKSQKQRNSNDNADKNLEQASEDSNIAKEKNKIKKKRNSEELGEILDEDTRLNSEKLADIAVEEHIEEAKTKRKRKSKDIDDDQHQAIKKPKALKITSPRKSFSPLEDIYNEEDAGEIMTKKNRRFKQTNTNLQHPKDFASSVAIDTSLKTSKHTNIEQKLSAEERTNNELRDSEKARKSPKISLGSLPEDLHNKEHIEETIKKISDTSDGDNIAKDLNSCIVNVDKEDSKSKKKRRSKTLEDNLDNVNQIPELKSPKKAPTAVSKDSKNENEGNLITKNYRRSKDLLHDSFEKNSTFAVVRKKKDSVDNDKCQKESPIKSFTAEEISNSILHSSTETNAVPELKNNTKELEELLECVDTAEAITKIGKDEIQERQVQKQEERIVPKKKSSPRKLDKDAFTKMEESKTQNVSNETQVQKQEDGIVPKKKSSPRKLDKEAFTKMDKNKTHNDSNEAQVQKQEGGIVPKKKLDKEAFTKIDKNKTHNDSNEIQVQTQEDGIVPNKKNSPRKLDKEALTKLDKNKIHNGLNETEVRKQDGIVPKKKLDKETFTKIDKNKTQNVSNEIQIQTHEDGIVPNKKSSPRKLHKEALTKMDKNKIHNVSNETQVQKLEERKVPKKKDGSRGLDGILTKPPGNKLAETPKLETKTKKDGSQIDSFASSEETNKNVSSEEKRGIEKHQKKIVIVSDILLHSGKPKEQTPMETETVNHELLNNENCPNSLPVHLDLPNLIKPETIINESKGNSILEKEDINKTKTDLPNVNRKSKTSKSVSRKDILLERYASEESQCKLNITFSENLNRNEEAPAITTLSFISEIKTENNAKKQENLEEKINNIRKRKGTEEVGVSDTVPTINPPKKRKVDLKLTEIESGNDKENQMEEIERKLQLMHDSKTHEDNIEDKEENASNTIENKEERHIEVAKTKPIALRRRKSKTEGVAVRKSPRNLKPKTLELKTSSNKDISVVEQSTVVTISNDNEERLGDLKTPVRNKEDEINNHKFSSISADNKNIDNNTPTEQKITVNSPTAKQKNSHFLPPPLGNIPVTSSSSPIGQLQKARKRITPIPIKDSPVCSFQNILEKNNTEFKIFSKNIILEPDLNLTDEGEIPILHLEENHFNNMEDATQKTFDRSIMKLLDCMNVSNLDCDISKMNEKVEGPALNSSLTFENVIGKVSNGTPVKNQTQSPIPVSSTPKVEVKERISTAAVGNVEKSEVVKVVSSIPNTNTNGINANVSETASSSNVTNTSAQAPVRFRRRCRIVAVRKL